MRQTIVLSFFCSTALACAAQGPWQQCGGIGWTGSITCTDGWTCQEQNPYYSQCLESTSSSPAPAISTKAPAPPTAPATSPAPVVTSSVAAAVAPPATSAKAVVSSSTSSTSPAATGLTFKASFTHYGAGDSFGSPNCNTNTAACGFFTSPGFSAAVSQNLFGVGPGAGAGPACGECWKLTGETDSSGNALSNAGTSIVVMINNLCPADGNPLCAQNGLSGTNQYGANVNFDLCSDSGAETAFFGNDGVGLAIGSATQVSCSEYSGTVVH